MLNKTYWKGKHKATCRALEVRCGLTSLPLPHPHIPSPSFHKQVCPQHGVKRLRYSPGNDMAHSIQPCVKFKESTGKVKGSGLRVVLDFVRQMRTEVMGPR